MYIAMPILKPNLSIFFMHKSTNFFKIFAVINIKKKILK